MRQLRTIVLWWMIAMQQPPAFSAADSTFNCPSPRVDSIDVVINEILFNPTADGAEYVEIYNKGKTVVNLANVYIATRGSNGMIGTKYALSKETRMLAAASYLVVTKDSAAVQKNYWVQQPAAFAVVSSLPRWNNKKGIVVIVTKTGTVIDELHYEENWHFPLLGSKVGVALERINYRQPTQDPNNWHSAASTVGFGTPTYQNSQFHSNDTLKAKMQLSTTVFSPNNDGQDDVAILHFLFEEPGNVCTVDIYDAHGRLVKNWVRNALCGITNVYTWDGSSNNHQPLPIGVYIVYAGVFNLQGKTKKFKQAITLARKL